MIKFSQNHNIKFQQNFSFYNLINNFLILNQPCQKGSTLVVATTMGVLVIGAVGLAISKASNDKINTITDNQTKQALGVAETGVTKIQDLFVKEPRLAMVKNNNQWTDIINAGKDQLYQTLNKTIGLSEVSQDTKCRTIQNLSSVNSGVLDGEGIIKKLQGEVIKVPSNNLKITPGVNDWVSLEEKKEYRLVSYNHNPITKKSILVIQGKIKDNIASIAQVEVTFDIIEYNIDKTKEKVPAIWITDSGNNFGNNQISGNVKIYSPTCKTLQAMGQNNKPLLNADNLINGGKIYIDKQLMPQTPDKPDDSILNIASAITEMTTFPLNITDEKDSDGYYHYLVPNVTLSNNQTLTIAADTKIVFYLQDDFNIGGDSEIVIPDTSNLQIYGNTYNSTKKISKYDCPKDAVECQTNKVLIRGNAISGNIFIHAPDAVVSVSGGNNTQSNFKGSIWAKSLNTSPNTITIEASGNYGDYLSGKNIIDNTYKISNISMWKTQPIISKSKN
ncbi:hypothetical protein [Geminocystis sp. NIES-3708]|uniref:hypothetical protein n=1 Tax=Geminocystis sp. NIES-3708 TaxID=1615909 RepID=UPI00082EC803|nr:hypothetical protein [Geminocystis sp. NIES-3708]